MSYAIIRNEKYKRANLGNLYRHIERRNKNYSNKNINKKLSYLNYSIKEPKYSYGKEFDRIKKQYNLKGQVKKVSNILCEYVITSDNLFFNSISEDEMRRYFETAYKFVCEYKNLGDEYILSAKIHRDEGSPHMHLIFIPVVHTKDRNGNNIDKIACSEFWKEKDSYRRLQDDFYECIAAHGFNLERGKESDRIHLSVEEYKRVTNFENTQKALKDIKIKLPKVPDINDFNKLTLNRDKKIQEEIIKPKDDLIEKLHKDNIKLHEELNRQVGIVNKAEKFEKEREELNLKNQELEQKCKDIEKNYSVKIKKIESDFERKNDITKSAYNELLKECELIKEDYNIRLNKETYKLEQEFKKKINKLENENTFLNKVINKFEKTLNKFIHWICKKFAVSEEEQLIRDFEKETNTLIDPRKQIEYEERENEWDLER